MTTGWRRLRILLAVAAIPIVLAGCGFGPFARSSVTSSSCAGLSSGACDEQAELIGRRHPGATTIDLVCTSPTCDRKGGTGTATVTWPDGRTVHDTFQYVGNPAALPAPTCAGMAVDVCRSLAESAAADLPPSAVVVAIDVRCRVLPCTPVKGEAETTVTSADGSVSAGGVAWDGGLP